ncbi:nitroreductase family protein [Streptomyces sp. NPDC050560]|uniref:nitroreductase family protein n=1 Tax=Streptomyces sp. NPDC050560 TaxID=3365630 RepID=UPI00379557F2
MPLIPPAEPVAALAGFVSRRAPLPPAAPTPPGAEAARAAGGHAPPVRGLDAVLRGRRSVRDFGADPVGAVLLHTVLGLAHDADLAQWPPTAQGDPGLWLLLAVRAAPPLAPGAYRWEPGTGPRPLGRPLPLGELASAYADAPVLALVCGSPTRVGPEAVGGLLVRAGALGHAIWLAARTHGLDCSVYGGASAEARGAASRAVPGARHLFTVALGHPARPSLDG